MKRSAIRPSTVHSKILLMSAVPVLVVSIALTWYYIGERRADQLKARQQIGQSSASYLATASELAMFANDMEGLRQIVRGIPTSFSVHRVTFYREDMTEALTVGQSGGNTAATVPREEQWRDDEYRDDLFWYFRSAIQLDAESISDYEEVESPAQVLGSVVLAFSLEDLNEANRQNIFIGSTISIIILLLASAVAGSLSRQIYRPIRDLTRTVEKMDSGDLSAQAEITGDREFKVLARVINQMANNIGEAKTRLKREVDDATTGLRKALGDIEERNSELNIIRDELENALGAKDQFLARMSHELRTPLTTVIGFTRRLENTSLDSEQSEYRHAIHHASLMLLSVINDILDFSRLQYGGIELEELEFDLEKEMEDIISMHGHNAFDQGLELVLFIDSDVPRLVQGDAMRLNQIVNNLLANSIKFTEEGQIVLHVRQATPDRTQVEVALEFSISDSGIGIAAKDRDKLFKPFVQADTSISRRFGGSGLGLVICRQLVELMDGEITIDSAEGEGTTASFTVQLKIAGSPQDAPLIPQRSDAVAVVDGNKWSRRALRNQLTHWTRQVYAVAGSEDLGRIINSRHLEFSTVVVNLGPAAMEEWQCREAASAIRQYYQGPLLLLFCPLDHASAIPQGLCREFAPARCLARPTRRGTLLGSLDEFNDSGPIPRSDIQQPGNEDDDPDLPEGRLQGIDILVAEDNSFNQRLLRALLESEGANVAVAENGAQAVQRFKDSDSTLVVMDAHMPLLDGIEACRQIVSEAAFSGRKVSVIGLTADTLETERQRFIQAGALDVLYKPLDEASLIETLCQYAGRVYKEDGDSCSVVTGTLGADLKRELEQQTLALRGSLDAGQLDRARMIAHQLLGLSGLYGVADIRACIGEIHACLATGPGAPPVESLEKLEVLVGEFAVETKT